MTGAAEHYWGILSSSFDKDGDGEISQAEFVQSFLEKALEMEGGVKHMPPADASVALWLLRTKMLVNERVSVLAKQLVEAFQATL